MGAKIGWRGELGITMIYGPPMFNSTHQHKQRYSISVVPKFHVVRETIRKEMYKKSP